MKYINTRDTMEVFSASEAIVMGDDGGLFVPSSFPNLGEEWIRSLIPLSYAERVAKVLSLYFDDFEYDELLEYAEKAYSDYEDDPCPTVKIEDGLYMLELWHGATCTYQDIALSMLPYLVTAAKKKLKRVDKTLMLVATCGDTGSAALEAFKDIDGVEVAVFYPHKGINPIERLQMTSASSKNAHMAGVVGSYDDVQTATENALNDKDVKSELAKLGYSMSVADSRNFVSIATQIAHYFSAYCDLVDGGEIEIGDKVNFAVPAGNLDNALAGYYAHRMGLPVGKLILATNANNALTGLFNDGEFDINRDFFKTISPSLDVLVPSNLERLIFETSGRDCTRVCEMLASLKEEGKFEIDAEAVRADIFEAGWADEEETLDAINTFFDLDDCVLDTHTAVVASVYNDYSCDTEDDTPTVILSTVNPYKTSADVLRAFGGKERDAYKAILKLQAITAMDCPDSLTRLFEKKEIHKTVIDKSEVESTVLAFAKER
ncbi:MAG: threonine synthase [Clostridia bacterium]|nr:threonine synthase [Clostridia bacterium]